MKRRDFLLSVPLVPLAALGTLTSSGDLELLEGRWLITVSRELLDLNSPMDIQRLVKRVKEEVQKRHPLAVPEGVTIKWLTKE